eukprot:COSAG02_NODE_1711_length_11223_cov_5.622348_14_plen_100_part_00
MCSLALEDRPRDKLVSIVFFKITKLISNQSKYEMANQREAKRARARECASRANTGHKAALCPVSVLASLFGTRRLLEIELLVEGCGTWQVTSTSLNLAS